MTRGRPRKFDEDAALGAAMAVFWQKGLAATSLDDLALAMNMNRPSIYNAFGNKEEIYRTTLSRFCAQMDQELQRMIESPGNLQSGLQAFFDRAVDVYCGASQSLGCLMICTAPSEALSHPKVGEDLAALLKRLDDGFTNRLERAQTEGELSADLKPRLTAKLLQATLQTLAIRARSGESKAGLRKLSRYAVSTLLC